MASEKGDLIQNWLRGAVRDGFGPALSEFDAAGVPAPAAFSVDGRQQLFLTPRPKRRRTSQQTLAWDIICAFRGGSHVTCGVRAFGCSFVYSMVPGWLRMSVSVDNWQAMHLFQLLSGHSAARRSLNKSLVCRLQVHILSGHEAG
jgi:hypothetical protein